MSKNTNECHTHLQYLHAQGVKFVLGTDDASHFDETTIGREYQKVAQVLELTPQQRLDITRHAITASFAEESLKTLLNQKLDYYEAKTTAIRELNALSTEGNILCKL